MSGNYKCAQILLDLEDAERKLRKYAHSPDCSHYMECPSQHNACKEKLGLDTALAWGLAGDAHNLNVYLRAYYYSNRAISIRIIKATITRLEISISVLEKALYKHDYTVLRHNITDLASTLEDVKTLLRTRKS